MKNISKYYLIFVALLLLWACGNDTISSSADVHFPLENVSYRDQVQPFIRFTCAYAGCHNQFDQAGGFSLDGYFDLTIAMSSAMVRANNPDGSILIQVFERKYAHLPVYWAATDAQITGLRKWISEGAKNN